MTSIGPLFPSDFQIDLNPLVQLTSRIHQPYFEITGACYGNMCGVSNLLQLPRVLVAGAFQDVANNAAYARALESFPRAEQGAPTAEQSPQFRDEVRKILGSDPMREFVSEGLAGLFSALMSETEPHKLLETQLCLALVIAWSNIEILADDLWDALPAELTSEINEAKNHGRPSFKNCKSIRKHYDKALQLPADRLAAFERTELRLLECFRHLFVHKGGLVDQKFMDDTTGNPLLPAGIATGDHFLPSSAAAQKMICSAIYACVELISVCESALADR